MKCFDRRGLEGLPLKLLVLLLLFSVSTPIVLENFQHHERVVQTEALRRECLDIRSAALSAFLSGPGNVRAVDVIIPWSGGSSFIEVGGEIASPQARSIRYYVDGRLCGTIAMSDAAVILSSRSNEAVVIGMPGGHVILSCVQTEDGLIVQVEGR